MCQAKDGLPVFPVSLLNPMDSPDGATKVRDVRSLRLLAPMTNSIDFGEEDVGAYGTSFLRSRSPKGSFSRASVSRLLLHG